MHTVTEHAPPVTSRRQHLDGLRGVASLVVVFTHLLLWFYPATVNGAADAAHSPAELTLFQSPVALLWSGNAAVCVFFVLSGFVLSVAFLRTGDHAALRDMALRRYPRLAVPVATSVLLGLLLVEAGALANRDRPGLFLTSPEVLSFWTQTGGPVAAAWQGLVGVFVHDYPYPEHFNGVLWTMHIEFIGSFLVFGVLALFPGRRARVAAYGFLAVALAHSYLLGFVLGLAIAELHTWTPRRPRALGAAAMAVGVALSQIPYPTEAVVTEPLLGAYRALSWGGVQFAHTIGAAGIVAGVLLLPAAQWLLATRPAVFLGRVSFALYLLHSFVIATIGRRLFAAVYDAGADYAAAFAVTAAASLVLSLAAAAVFTRQVDDRGIALSRQVAAWLWPSDRRRHF